MGERQEREGDNFIRPAAALFERDLLLADHSPPALQLDAYPPIELAGRSARGLQAQLGKPLPYLRLYENSRHFRIDPRHDLRRRLRRLEQRHPRLRRSWRGS